MNGVFSIPAFCSCGLHAIVCSQLWLITALPLFFLQGPCGCGGLSQARGFPDLPARVKGAERRAWVTTNRHLSSISRQPYPLQLPTKLSSRVQNLQQKPCGEVWFQTLGAASEEILNYPNIKFLISWIFLFFSRVMSKLRQTQRLATGKSTNTSFSTHSVRLPWWRKSKLRRHKVTHHPRLQTRWAMDPSHPQRRGLEKCLVRLIGNWKKMHLLDQKVNNKKPYKFLIIDMS